MAITAERKESRNMKSLRTYARGKSCYLRLPGCSHDPEKTSLAHIRIGGIAGTGIKPPDICALPLDDYCHAIVDGRVKTGLRKVDIHADLLRAHNQWLADLWADEVIAVIL